MFLGGFVSIVLVLVIGYHYRTTKSAILENVGATGSAGFYIGPRESTRVSSIGFNLAVISKRQLIATIESNLYTPDNGFFLQGDWRFLIYNAATWDLGTNAPDSIESLNMFVWQGAEIYPCFIMSGRE